MRTNRDDGFTSKCDETEAKPMDTPQKLLDKHAKPPAEFGKVGVEGDAQRLHQGRAHAALEFGQALAGYGF